MGHETVTAQRPGVPVVPISHVMPSSLVEPTVSDAAGNGIGVTQIPHIGEVTKTRLTAQVGVLAPASVEVVDIALRAALDL